MRPEEIQMTKKLFSVLQAVKLTRMNKNLVSTTKPMMLPGEVVEEVAVDNGEEMMENLEVEVTGEVAKHGEVQVKAKRCTVETGKVIAEAAVVLEVAGNLWIPKVKMESEANKFGAVMQREVVGTTLVVLEGEETLTGATVRQLEPKISMMTSKLCKKAVRDMEVIEVEAE
jgi:hypothetical protein